MGQKTHPIGFRLGIIKTWNSHWFAPDNKFADLVHEDLQVKRYIKRRLDNAGIAKVCISRAPKKVTVDIHTSRPGIVIGRKGAEVDKLRSELQMLTKNDILLNIIEVRKPELNAQLVADSIARQLVGRVSFRRAMKKTIASTMKMGAMGIKVRCSGRLGGAEIARDEKYKEGRTPLHTIRADIDYATSTAHTTYGCIGVKVWICKGEILEKGNFYESKEKKEADANDHGSRGQHRRPRPGGGPGGPGGGPGGGGDRNRKRPRGKIRRKPDDRSAGDSAPRGRRPEKAVAPKASPAPKTESKAKDAPKASPAQRTESKAKDAPKAKPAPRAPKAESKTDKKQSDSKPGSES